MAELPRFFLSQGSLDTQKITVSGDALRHLRLVLRLKPGAEALILDGSGTCCKVQFISISRDEALADVLSTWQIKETALPICLQQAIPKGDKFELVLQKGTELGITTFQPVISLRTVPQPDPRRMTTRQQRWARIISEAARQCRRGILPCLEPIRELAEAVTSHPEYLHLVLWEAGTEPLSAKLPEERPAGVNLLIGPEGGFGPEEITLIKQAGYQPVHLGPRILRTETAGLAATSILQYLYGDLHHAPNKCEETI